VTKVRQSCGEVGTTLRRMPTRNSWRRAAPLPAEDAVRISWRDSASFQRLETSFMNATRNFNRFVCRHVDYRCERAQGKTCSATQVAADERHECYCTLLFPRITFEILVIANHYYLLIQVIEIPRRDLNFEK